MNIFMLVGIILCLGTTIFCRSPGTKYGSFFRPGGLSIKNRHEKLTPLGAKIYVASICFMFAGIVAKLLWWLVN